MLFWLDNCYTKYIMQLYWVVNCYKIEMLQWFSGIIVITLIYYIYIFGIIVITLIRWDYFFGIIVITLILCSYIGEKIVITLIFCYYIEGIFCNIYMLQLNLCLIYMTLVLCGNTEGIIFVTFYHAIILRHNFYDIDILQFYSWDLRNKFDIICLY